MRRLDPRCSRAVDASPRGLEKLGRLAQARGVVVTAIAHDLASFPLGDQRWDGIYNIYWSYKNWQRIKSRSREDISPFWRAFFAGMTAIGEGGGDSAAGDGATLRVILDQSDLPITGDPS